MRVFVKEYSWSLLILSINFLCLFSGSKEIIKALGPDAGYTRTGIL